MGGALSPEDHRDDPDFGGFDMDTPSYDAYEDDRNPPESMPDADDAREETSDTYDQYVGASVNVPIGDEIRTGKVTGRKREVDNTFAGIANSNTMLDTRKYDGRSDEYIVNIIAQNMYAQCDEEGNQFNLMDGIVGHKTDGHAVTPVDMYIKHGSNRQVRKTTIGWHLCVEWKDGTTSWERLADIKESNPVEVAEYAIGKDLQDKPDFAWWVPHVLKKRHRIISSVMKRDLKRNHKLGIEISTTWNDCVRLDKENNTTLWQDAFHKEMKNVRIAFKILSGEEAVPPTYQQITCHVIFDVKMEDFRRKAHFVAGGHTTDMPHAMTYASVVSRESVRIALILAALNDLEVKMADIENTYLTAPITEKVWCILGPDFGEDAGKKALIVRALYGLKSTGAAFRNHLTECMKHFGWKSCRADRDLWMKRQISPDDGFEYWAYILIYVNDILCMHHNPGDELVRLDKYFKMKDGSIQVLTFYLGAKLKETVLPNGVIAWGMSSSKYVNADFENVREYLVTSAGGQTLKKKVTVPFPVDYRPEMDVTPELTPGMANYYQTQIGVLICCVELDRIDIVT
jgi:hypothetical protein